MASLFASTTNESRPFKLDTKDIEVTEHVEIVEDVRVQVDDIHLGSPEAFEPRHDESRVSLLTLPVEIRLQIYEMAYDATFIHSRLEWESGLKLRLQGSSSTRSPSVKLSGSPFTLLRVCRTLYTEVMPMLPPISHVALQFDKFSQEDMLRWLELLSDSQIAQARLFEITGWASCRLKHPLYADGHHMNCRRYRSFNSVHPIACTGSCNDTYDEYDESVTQAKQGLCDRSLTLDLKAFEGQFQAERFERIMKNLPRFDAVDPCSQREFEKACYLLRVIDGCVHRPQPDGHPPGRNSQCGTVIVVEAAVAGFVSNEGGLLVTKENVLGLLRATMGGPS